MRIYETTFIVNPQTDDSVIDGQVKEVSGLITSNSGKILHEDRMGTRKLAYPIRGLHHGYYTTITFEGTNDLLKALDRFYHLQDSYLRHLTVLYEGEVEKIGQPIDPFGFGSEAEGEGEGHRGRPRHGRFQRRDYDGGGGRSYDRGDRGDRNDREDRGPRSAQATTTSEEGSSASDANDE